mmetsp:Transcript_5457/g.16252  ORF Transcript_5457/g.16252 Transcript_5457/m.16252 type:complete len:505 (-) Transcript_5457:157-1671(-)
MREAFLAWEPRTFERVKANLRAEGKSDNEVTSMTHYSVAHFRSRCPRAMLPPSKLYWRVRAVYELFGDRVDSETGRPLFSADAWKKANSVLREIQAGHASDPPGFSFYTQRYDVNGVPVVDKHGVPLIDCSRGTNRTEGVHKHLAVAVDDWSTGVRFGDTVMLEHRQRHNTHVSERRRRGFPRLGMFDTWLIDKLQVLIAHNHNVVWHPEWSNASDFARTDEAFGTVPLFSATNELAAAIKGIQIDNTAKMTADQKYLAERFGTQLPCLPIHGEDEHKLFAELSSSMADPADFDAMAVAWCKHVNGHTIFPKLPVYLRLHYTAYTRNQRVRSALASVELGAARLTRVNEITAPAPGPVDAPLAPVPFCSDPVHLPERETVPDAASGQRPPLPCLATSTPVAIAPAWPRVASLPTQAQPPPSADTRVLLVGGGYAGSGILAQARRAAEHATAAAQPRKRGHDYQPRKPRTCRTCKRTDCAGAKGGPNSGQRVCHFSDQADGRELG